MLCFVVSCCAVLCFVVGFVVQCRSVLPCVLCCLVYCVALCCVGLHRGVVCHAVPCRTVPRCGVMVGGVCWCVVACCVAMHRVAWCVVRCPGVARCNVVLRGGNLRCRALCVGVLCVGLLCFVGNSKVQKGIQESVQDFLVFRFLYLALWKLGKLGHREVWMKIIYSYNF